MVFVLSKTKQPLMPTEDHRMVRLLLKNKKAKVASMSPFTIQLLCDVHNYKQRIRLGVDAGSKTIGLSACTERKELFRAEFKPRNDVVKLLSKRRELRRTRRNRTTRYRVARFDNRVHAKHKGWLAPSVEVKIHNHEQAIKAVTDILPVSEIIVETAEFDLQRLKAMEEGKPLPVGTDYQLGEQYDTYNVRQYVLFRDNYTCQCCKKKPNDKNKLKLVVHHIESRQTGGNAPNNLITICENCHKAYHAGAIQLPKHIKRGKSYKDAVFMGIMRKTIIQRLRVKYSIPVKETYGYITKLRREENGIAKSHTNDARCIAGYPVLQPTKDLYLMRPVRAHNRKLHKETINKGGTRKSNQCPKYMFGYRLFDMVKYKGEMCFVFGRRSDGGFDIRHLDGTTVNPNVNYKKLSLTQRQRNILIERIKANFSQG